MTDGQHHWEFSFSLTNVSYVLDKAFPLATAPDIFLSQKIANITGSKHYLQFCMCCKREDILVFYLVSLTIVFLFSYCFKFSFFVSLFVFPFFCVHCFYFVCPSHFSISFILFAFNRLQKFSLDFNPNIFKYFYLILIKCTRK